MSSVAHLPIGIPALPSNVEAEAALIGALLIENSILDRVAKILSADDFFEPLHSRIFILAERAIAEGRTASPVTLRPMLENDEGLVALGGTAYLARLTADGQGLLAPLDLAEQIHELAVRRRRLEWLDHERAVCADLSKPLDELNPPADAGLTERALPFLDLARLSSIEPEPKAFIIPRLAPAGEVTLFTGAGAVGKSLLAQQLATALSAGTSTLGLSLDKAPAIYLTCEDDTAQLHFRQAHICRMLAISMVSLVGKLHLASLRGELDNALALPDQGGRLVPTLLYHRIAALVRTTGARLAALDNVAHLFTGNENDRGEVTQFVNLLNRLAGETGAAILLLGHPNKGGDTYSGSTAWLNAVRSQIVMERPKDAEHDKDLRAIHLGKPNYVAAGEALRCRWQNWAFVRDEDLPDDRRAELSQVIAASAENEAFLACLRERSTQGDGRTVGPNAGGNFAPAQFEGMPAARGFSRTALKRAMERLFTLGKIESITVRNKAKGRDVTIIREVKSGSPNATPDASRTLFPDCPERIPNASRTVPAHTPSPTERGGGALQGAPTTNFDLT